MQGHIVHGIKDKMKDYRQAPRNMTRIVRQPSSIQAKQEPADDQSPVDDEVSMKRHISMLQTEHKKRKPNTQVTRDLMERTYEWRKKFIATKVVKDTLAEFPFLQDYDEVSSRFVYVNHISYKREDDKSNGKYQEYINSS